MIRSIILPILLMVSSASAADQPASGTTPYLALYGVLAPARSIQAYDRLEAVERIESKLPGVRAHDIRLTIHARRGAIVVPVAADGSVDFPADAELQAENPAVETNQPKGSLMLSVHAALRVPASLDVAWSEIDAGLQQAQALFATTTEGSAANAKPRGVEILFDGDLPASVTIDGRGEQLLQAGADGRVLVTREMVAGADHPRLKFSRRPRRLLPWAGD